MDRTAFGKDTKKGASFTDWRKEGKVLFFVHTGSEIEKRTTVQLRRVVEDDDGEEKIQGIRRFYEGETDITKQFLVWLKNDTPDLDPDDVVLRVKSASDEEEYTKGELLAMKGYAWQKNLLRPKTEYLFCIINVTEKGKVPKGCEVLVLPYSAGKKLNKIWDGEIEELGEEEGDPWKTPYACKVTFDKDERGSDMYQAGTVKRPLTEPVRDLFDEEAIDLKQYTKEESVQDPDAGTATDLLRAMCVVPCPLLGTDVESEETPKPKGKKKTKTAKKPAKKTKPDPEPEPEPEPEEEPEPKPKLKPKAPKKPGKPKGKKQPPALVDVEDAEPGESYIYDGDEVVFLKWNAKKKIGIAKDEDDLKVVIPVGEELVPVAAAEPEPEPEPEEEPESEGGPEPTKVTQCVKGEAYYDQDGNKLTFVRYNHTKEKGVFSDSEGERIFMDGDELVSGDDTDSGPDPLEPKAKKTPTKQTKPKKKVVDPEPEEPEADDDMEECPACEKMVASDATSCPHCKAEFQEEDEDDVPFD